MLSYYGVRTLQRSGGQGVKGNFFDVATREEYWVSGPKKRGGDAHPAARATVMIDEDVQEEYWTTIHS